MNKSFNYLITAFHAYLCAKFIITLSKSIFLAMLDSMFRLARSTSRVCDIIDPKYFFGSLILLKDLSADATVAGIVNNIRKPIQTFKIIHAICFLLANLAIKNVSAMFFKTWPCVQLVYVAFLLQDLHH